MVAAEETAIKRHIIMPPHAAEAIALWIAHTHLVERFRRRDPAGAVLIVAQSERKRRRRTAASVLNTAAWLAFQVKDAERWRSWLNRRAASERADISNI